MKDLDMQASTIEANQGDDIVVSIGGNSETFTAYIVSLVRQRTCQVSR